MRDAARNEQSSLVRRLAGRQRLGERSSLSISLSLSLSLSLCLSLSFARPLEQPPSPLSDPRARETRGSACKCKFRAERIVRGSRERRTGGSFSWDRLVASRHPARSVVPSGASSSFRNVRPRYALLHWGGLKVNRRSVSWTRMEWPGEHVDDEDDAAAQSRNCPARSTTELRGFARGLHARSPSRLVSSHLVSSRGVAVSEART